MKKLLFVFVLVLSGLFILNSCSGEKKSQTQKQEETTVEKTINVSVDMLTTDKDLICGKTLTNETIADTAIYQGQLYGFCSEECKAKFKENPDSAIAKLDKPDSEE